MSPRYSLQVSRTSNLYLATCIRIHVARPGYMFPGDKCPGVNAALGEFTTESVTNGQCDARPTVTFPSQPQSITAHWRYQIILLGDRGTCVSEQVAQGRYIQYNMKVERPGVEPATIIARERLNTTTPHPVLLMQIVTVW